MLFYNRVIWHEGMFLQPQHFQQQERYLENLVQHKVTACHSNFWGMQELTLDNSLLSIAKIGIKQAKGIFPDGTCFDMSKSEKLPLPLEITKEMNNSKLYLAIPLRQADISEAGTEDAKQRFRNKVFTSEVNDAIADSYNAVEIQMGSLACVLLSDRDDLSGYSVLPIANILEVRVDGQVILDDSFVVTWINVHACSMLSKFLQEVTALIENRAAMLSSRLTDENYVGTAEIIDFMLLQLMNKYELLFKNLLTTSPLHPETFYQISIQLMGEIATYTTKNRRPINTVKYNHNNIYHTYKLLMSEIRDSLGMVLEQNAIKIALTSTVYGTWTGKIVDRHLLTHCQFVLSVHSDTPIDSLKLSFPNQVKIASTTQIETLINKALPGACITPLSIAPKQIPFHANHAYFLIDTKSSYWKNLETTGAIALHVGKKIPGLKLELWAIKG